MNKSTSLLSMLFLQLTVMTTAALASAAEDLGTLKIQVRTNLSPVTQFTMVKTVVSSPGGRVVKTSTYRAMRSTDPAGFRVAELRFPPGTYNVRVGMYNRNTLLTERPIGNVNIVKHTIRVVAVLLTAEKETSVKFIGQKSRQTGQQMKRDMKNTGKAASYLAGSVVPQKKKRAVPNFVKRPQSIQPPSRSQPGRSISIGVNYIARKPAPGKTAAGMVPRTRNRIAISNINYISGKPDRRNKIPPAEIRPSNAIAIGNINYIARKTMQRGGSSRVQAPSSNRIDINNINYIARKRQ